VEVVVTGIGLVSALGMLQTSWQRLIAGESGIRLSQPFRELPPRPLALIGKTPMYPGAASPGSAFPGGAWERGTTQDTSAADLTTLTQLVVTEAIADAGLVLPLPDAGVAIGSSRAHQASWEQLARQLQEDSLMSGAHWLDTLPHMVAHASARTIGSTGPVLAPMAACATGLWAIAQGFHLIQTGQCQRAIAGAVEAPVTPLTLAGFTRMGALAATGAYPFDKNREGLVLGEGAAVLVLESATVARRRGARVYGRVLGFGFTNDGYHAIVPELGGKRAIGAVKQCLERSGLETADIDYIHAHGTSTRLNDQNEAKLIQYLFPQGVPVSSTKGATGHSLGASGALGVAFCLMALQEQLLPPSVGLKAPEFDLDLLMAPRRCQVRRVLCLSFGFGGQNGAIVLGK